MKKRFRRGISLFLTIVMATSLSLSSCSSNSQETSTSSGEGDSSVSEGSSAESSEPVELDIIARKLVDANEDNVILHELENRLNLKLNYTWKPSEDYAGQCAIIIASGDYPDMMEYWCSTFPVEIRQLADDGVILPIDDLLQEYGQNILNTFPDEQFYYHSDGKRYAVPCRNIEIGLDELFLVRQDWLDRVGMEVPTNLDELYDVLVAFKEQDANGNGDPNDEIPWGYAASGSATVDPLKLICTAYDILYEWNYGWNTDENGKLVYFLEMPEFREALRFNRQLYQEGLIDPEYTILTRDTYMEKRNTDQYGVEGWWFTELDPAIATWSSDFYNAVPQAEFASLKWFKGPDNEAHFIAEFEKPADIIFSQSEHPVECMKLMDYLCSQEGNDLAVMGIEGEHWTEENGVITQKEFTDSEAKEIGLNMYKWLLLPRYVPRSTSEYYQSFVDYEPGTIIWAPTYAPEEKQKYWTELGNIFKNGRDRLITETDIDFDTEFDNLVQLWKSSGGDEVTAAMNREAEADQK